MVTIEPFLRLENKTSFQHPWFTNKANAWLEDTGWLVGCNYVPSYAVNQLEMWQADTFDISCINKELSWAEAIGFNTVRVFLHHLLWEQDSKRFLKRINKFLDVADSHGIKTMFVFFDSVWNPNPKSGIQKAPVLGVHNSGWVQCPGFEILNDVTRHDSLKGYVQGIINKFKKDERVVAWDLFNEPDNENENSYKDLNYCLPKAHLALELLKKAFAWAREINPVQPLTTAAWKENWNCPVQTYMHEYMFNESDIISFHCYADKNKTEEKLILLQKYDKPILCTEYMARPLQSTFDEILPLFRKYKVGAYNWGLVEGKSQTHFPWDSWLRTYDQEPSVWFHDIFRANGEPYDKAEIEFIREITAKQVETSYHKVA